MRTSLERERAAIRERLAELERVLGNPTSEQGLTAGDRTARQAGQTQTRQASGVRRGTRRGQLTIRDAITTATQRGPVGISDLVPAVKKLGYKFTSKNPVNSLGAYLYGPAGKEHFRRVEGGFIPR